MRIIDADPTRMIDLPGAGPCPRPVDIDQRLTGFTWLKSLRIYRFAPGIAIDGESEDDEVYVVPLDGPVRMEISGAYPLRADLGPRAARALYMTPQHGYRLVPGASALVAYARAAAEGRVATHTLAGTAGDGAEHLRLRLAELDGDALDTDAGQERLIHVIHGALSADGEPVVAGQTLALAAGEAPALRGVAHLLIVAA